MNKNIVINILKEFDPNFSKLDNVSPFKYKNIWNFIVIKWHYCINNINKNTQFHTHDIYTQHQNINADKFYQLLIDFIESNNMKKKFVYLCIDKYL